VSAAPPAGSERIGEWDEGGRRRRRSLHAAVPCTPPAVLWSRRRCVTAGTGRCGAPVLPCPPVATAPYGDGYPTLAPTLGLGPVPAAALTGPSGWQAAIPRPTRHGRPRRWPDATATATTRPSRRPWAAHCAPRSRLPRPGRGPTWPGRVGTDGYRQWQSVRQCIYGCSAFARAPG
jgi:hypothetical protein